MRDGGGRVSDESDPLVKASVQWTREQYAWLLDRARRLGLRSISAAARMTVQEAMNAEYRATTTDVDVEQ